MIFISYSHSDHIWKERIEDELKAIANYSPHERFYWSDSDISTGDKWREEINLAKDKTSIAVFLVSRDFMKSEFIKNEEFRYFVNKEDVRVFWFLLSPCNWALIEELKEREAVKFKNKKLEPLSKLSKVKADELITSACREMYDFIIQNDVSRLTFSKEIVYCCNRSKEIELFEISTAVYTDISQGKNLLLYSIEGVVQDDLESLSKSFRYKVLRDRYEFLKPNWNVKLININLGPLINDGRINPEILLIKFKSKLQISLNLPVDNIKNITVNDILAGKNLAENEKVIYFITVSIPSTSFNRIIYNPFFTWVRDKFSPIETPNPNIIIYVLFAFEKNGDIKDIALEDFVKKLINKSTLPKLITKRNVQWPDPKVSILHLGQHSEVFPEQIEEWNKSYRNGLSIKPIFNQKLTAKMRMADAIELLLNLLSKK